MRKPTLEKNLDLFSIESNITPDAEYTELDTHGLVRVNLPLCGRHWVVIPLSPHWDLSSWSRNFIALTAPPQSLREEMVAHFLNVEWMRRQRGECTRLFLQVDVYIAVRRAGAISLAKARMRQGGRPSMCKGQGVEESRVCVESREVFGATEGNREGTGLQIKTEAVGGWERSQVLEVPQSELREPPMVVGGRRQVEAGRRGDRAGKDWPESQGLSIREWGRIPSGE